jgi:MYXO-CTERM domain-containing protein
MSTRRVSALLVTVLATSASALTPNEAFGQQDKFYTREIRNLNGNVAAMNADGVEVTFPVNTVGQLKVRDRNGGNLIEAVKNQKVFTVASNQGFSVPSSTMSAPAANSSADVYWSYKFSPATNIESGKWLRSNANTNGLFTFGGPRGELRKMPQMQTESEFMALDLFNDESETALFENVRVWLDLPISNYTIDSFAQPIGAPDMTFSSIPVDAGSMTTISLGTVAPDRYALVLANTRLSSQSPGSAYSFGVAADVPEPTALGLLGMAAVPALRRRRAPSP